MAHDLPRVVENCLMHPRLGMLTMSLFRATAAAAALLLVTVLVVNRSEAAFTATTSNSSSGFATGSLSLTDDDAGSALFTASDMTPGTPTVQCIEVTYAGTVLPAPVRLYGSATGTLATYLDTTVEVGSGGAFSNCAGFTPSSTIYTGTLANFSATHSNWTSAVPVFTAASTPSVVTLRFTVDVQNDNAAQGTTATADFIFETQG